MSLTKTNIQIQGIEIGKTGQNSKGPWQKYSYKMNENGKTYFYTYFVKSDSPLLPFKMGDWVDIDYTESPNPRRPEYPYKNIVNMRPSLPPAQQQNPQFGQNVQQMNVPQQPQQYQNPQYNQTTQMPRQPQQYQQPQTLNFNQNPQHIQVLSLGRQVIQEMNIASQQDKQMWINPHVHDKDWFRQFICTQNTFQPAVNSLTPQLLDLLYTEFVTNWRE